MKKTETAETKPAGSALKKPAYSGNARSRQAAIRKQRASMMEAAAIRREIFQDEEILKENTAAFEAGKLPAYIPGPLPEADNETAWTYQAPVPSEKPVREDAHTQIEIYRTADKHKELKTLDELKEEFRRVYMKDGEIYQKDILASLSRLDMTDDDMEALWNWFSEEDMNCRS